MNTVEMDDTSAKAMYDIALNGFLRSLGVMFQINPMASTVELAERLAVACCSSVKPYSREALIEKMQEVSKMAGERFDDVLPTMVEAAVKNGVTVPDDVQSVVALRQAKQEGAIN